VLYNSYLEPNNKAKRNWIKPDILYAEKHKGGYGQIKVTDFLKAIKTSWVKRYATDRLNNHWCDILDTQFGLTPNTRETIYEWGANKFDNVIKLNLPCVSGFIKCYQEFCKNFFTEPNPRENRWLSAPFFHNPKILWGPGENNLDLKKRLKG
jgi:hypothetical protein